MKRTCKIELLAHTFYCKKYTYIRNDVGLALLAPFRDLGICSSGSISSVVTREQSEETQRPTLNNVYLVHRYGMDNLPPFLHFTFGASNEFNLRTISWSDNLAEKVEHAITYKAS